MEHAEGDGGIAISGVDAGGVFVRARLERSATGEAACWRPCLAVQVGIGRCRKGEETCRLQLALQLPARRVRNWKFLPISLHSCVLRLVKNALRVYFWMSAGVTDSIISSFVMLFPF